MIYSDYIYTWHKPLRCAAGMLKGRIHAQNGRDKLEKMVWKKMGYSSVGMTTFRQKKTTASVEDGEQEVAVFWKKIWGWGS